MLSNEDNELLCRVGKGTGMGEYMRRFWLPALTSAELSAPDSPPKRLRIMGEDLLAFRDSSGKVGLVDAYCPHKLAPLFFGRNEENGLRCVYHGWKFDTQGNCVDIPNLPSTSNIAALKERARITAYPTREAGGLVWVYMGPAGAMPPMPLHDWLQVPSDQVRVARWLQRSNWAQGMEGEIDTSHVSFLHGMLSGTASPSLPLAMRDGAPQITLKETDYGFIYGARRGSGSPEPHYWRVTQWFMPMFSMIPNDAEDAYPRGGRAWVPIDDDHTMIFTYSYRHDKPLTAEHHQMFESGLGFPPPIEEGTYQLPDGYVIDAFLPLACRENNYLIDRERQRDVAFSGVLGITDQDRSLQENMRSGAGRGPGRIADRPSEMLVPSDLPVITARRMLLKQVKSLQSGTEPVLPHKPELYRHRSATTFTAESSFEGVLQLDEIKSRIL